MSIFKKEIVSSTNQSWIGIKQTLQTLLVFLIIFVFVSMIAPSVIIFGFFKDTTAIAIFAIIFFVSTFISTYLLRNKILNSYVVIKASLVTVLFLLSPILLFDVVSYGLDLTTLLYTALFLFVYLFVLKFSMKIFVKVIAV